MLPEDKNIWSRETRKTRWFACVNTTGTRCSMRLRLIPFSCLIMFLSTHQCKSGISLRIKNRLYPIFPGKSLVFHHLAHFGRSDYATNGLHTALPSSSGDVNGWFHYSHSTKLTPQITTRGPRWKGLWGPRCELCLLIDTGGYHFSWFLLPFGPGFLPTYSNNKNESRPSQHRQTKEEPSLWFQK